jgi:mevalonate kinase
MDKYTTIETIDKDLELIRETILNLQSITYGKAQDYIKAFAQNALNNINEIQADLKNLKTDITNESSPRYVKKMLEGSKTLCEEHGTLVKDIIDTPKTSEEQIAEDFVENHLPKNFVEDFLKQ